jgi:hypothetical protein
VFQDAGGLVSDSDIFKNGGVGICITQGADPRVEQCRLFQGLSCALLVQDGGKGMVRHNSLHGHIYLFLTF